MEPDQPRSWLILTFAHSGHTALFHRIGEVVISCVLRVADFKYVVPTNVGARPKGAPWK